MKNFLNFVNGEFVFTGKTVVNRTPVDNRRICRARTAGPTLANVHA